MQNQPSMNPIEYEYSGRRSIGPQSPEALIKSGPRNGGETPQLQDWCRFVRAFPTGKYRRMWICDSRALSKSVRGGHARCGGADPWIDEVISLYSQARANVQ